MTDETKDRTPYDKFEVEVERAINKVSLENESDTPDYISAEFIRKVFELFNKAIRERTRWYGKAEEVKETPPPVNFQVHKIVSGEAGPGLYCTSVFSNMPIPTEKQEFISKLIENYMKP